MARRPGFGSLLLAGLAAFGLYKYSQMSEEEKRNLKDKGKKFVDENLGSLKDMFGGKQQASNTANQAGNGQNM
ncbi:MAG: hypothetical protein ICV51_02260 [Flavisolibacter sp.]|nr:hypothetical protein [Flavisolibacter sp.]MBD0288337.1 hypothetical protein [Flavisolibacter sp.]MBD0374437.1 hypothetical protein [Flavisolibacter sp.]